MPDEKRTERIVGRMVKGNFLKSAWNLVVAFVARAKEHQTMNSEEAKVTRGR